MSWLRTAALAAALSLVFGLGAATVPRPAVAAPPGPKDVTATLFEWKFASVAQACTTVLGPKGYGYVEVSPAQEHIQGPQWWTSYQPVSYRIAGRLGDRAAFQNMVNTCHAAGVKVIADAVINHMVISGPGTGTGGSSYSKYNYPGIYQDWDFHGCRQPISNYGDRGNVQNCELGGLADLDTGSEYVRTRLATYLNDLISLGVDGFRIDAAKHMAYTDLVAIKAKLTNPNIFWVYEVIYGAGEAVQPGEYVGNGDVDEFRYAYDLKRIFTSERLAYLSNFGEAWGYLPTGKARSFVDNWDTERNHSTLDRTYGSTYTLANVFMLAHPYGSPNVYSGYVVSSHDGGPPNGGQVNACYQDGWTCTHAWPQIANMVGFRAAVAGTGVTNWWSNGNNAIAFGRGTKGFVVINKETGAVSQTFQTSLPAGVYCDVQHGEPAGGCVGGHAYTVGSDGRFTATVGAGDAIALHVNARVTAGVSFNVNATTSWGQNIFVVGSTPALGSWNTAAAVPLSSATYPVWRLGVGMTPGSSFQYKYLRKDAGGVITWESGANRTGTVPGSGLVTFNDTWRP
ncbi:MAG TPA: carbohydrate-binding module family 20 domain-containing protein [Pseudonocardiaceae bacterium]